MARKPAKPKARAKAAKKAKSPPTEGAPAAPEPVEAEKGKRGRPSLCTPAIIAAICSRIANGETLTRICKDESMPARRTVTDWLIDDTKKDFTAQYARARAAQADFWADETLDIADDATNDFMVQQSADGGKTEVLNREHIQRSKLRIEQRNWLGERLNPKQYGQRTKLEHDGSDAFLKMFRMIGSGQAG